MSCQLGDGQGQFHDEGQLVGGSWPRSAGQIEEDAGLVGIEHAVGGHRISSRSSSFHGTAGHLSWRSSSSATTWQQGRQSGSPQ